MHLKLQKTASNDTNFFCFVYDGKKSFSLCDKQKVFVACIEHACCLLRIYFICKLQKGLN